jgi:hypothetical protein
MRVAGATARLDLDVGGEGRREECDGPRGGRLHIGGYMEPSKRRLETYRPVNH